MNPAWLLDRSGRVSPVVALTVGGAAAAMSMALLWGFTVDDALISARVAHQLALDHGYRFNPHGGVVDAVTPLGWAWCLVPFAKGSVQGALEAARWLGALAWLGTGALTGLAVARVSGSPWRWLALAGMALCVGGGAWSSSGMETPLIALLVAASLVAPGARFALAGLAAALRPELLPWALVAHGAELITVRGGGARRTALGLVGLLAPTACAMMVRAWAFGRVMPLSLLAKPPDLDSGLRYVVVSLVWMGPPWLLASLLGWRRLTKSELWGAGALVAHALSVLVAGGDWMAFHRLWVPVLPAMLVVAAALAGRTPPLSSGVRLALMAAVSGVLWFKVGLPARHIHDVRTALALRARPALRPFRRVATLDVGWVGAAYDGDVVDLAGVTDPEVAGFAGGHTSRRIPDGWLLARGVDAAVLLEEASPLPGGSWSGALWARAVEGRVAQQLDGDGFVPVARWEVQGTGQRYVLVVRREVASISEFPAGGGLPVGEGGARKPFSASRVWDR